MKAPTVRVRKCLLANSIIQSFPASPESLLGPLALTLAPGCGCGEGSVARVPSEIESFERRLWRATEILILRYSKFHGCRELQ
jgi:hypothetical protein